MEQINCTRLGRRSADHYTVSELTAAMRGVLSR